jgi:hypothetical protein
MNVKPLWRYRITKYEISGTDARKTSSNKRRRRRSIASRRVNLNCEDRSDRALHVSFRTKNDCASDIVRPPAAREKKREEKRLFLEK